MTPETQTQGPFSQGRMDFQWDAPGPATAAAPEREDKGLLGGNPWHRPDRHDVPDWARGQPFVRALMRDDGRAANASAFRRCLQAADEIEIEIGAGRGDFLLARAARYPQRLFVGFEVKTKAAGKLLQRVAAADLRQVWICDDDARFGIPRLFPDRRAAAVHILFPDPWWKKEHRARRLFTSAFVSLLARTLRPGGLLHMRSDVAELVRQAALLVAQSQAFLPSDAQLSARLAPYQPTHREMWCQARALPVYTLFCQRRRVSRV